MRFLSFVSFRGSRGAQTCRCYRPRSISESVHPVTGCAEISCVSRRDAALKRAFRRRELRVLLAVFALNGVMWLRRAWSSLTDSAAAARALVWVKLWLDRARWKRGVEVPVDCDIAPVDACELFFILTCLTCGGFARGSVLTDRTRPSAELFYQVIPFVAARRGYK